VFCYVLVRFCKSGGVLPCTYIHVRRYTLERVAVWYLYTTAAPLLRSAAASAYLRRYM